MRAVSRLLQYVANAQLCLLQHQTNYCFDVFCWGSLDVSPPPKLDSQKCYSLPSEGSVCFFLSHRCSSEKVYNKLVYIYSVGMKDELLLGQCSLVHFRSSVMRL